MLKQKFYIEMFRLRRWPYPPFNVKGAPKGPRYAGKLTRMLVYEKLPNGVIEELGKRNQPNEKWQRKHKLFQDLTSDIGNPHLEKQVAVVTTLIKISPNWKSFERNFRRAFPSGPEQMEWNGLKKMISYSQAILFYFRFFLQICCQFLKWLFEFMI